MCETNFSGEQTPWYWLAAQSDLPLNRVSAR